MTRCRSAALRHPAARLAFVEAAVIDELDVEPAERGGRLEHLALDAAGAVPGRLAARRRVERKDQPAAPARRGRRRRAPQVAQKGIDLGRSGFGRKLALGRHSAAYHADWQSLYAQSRRKPGPTIRIRTCTAGPGFRRGCTGRHFHRRLYAGRSQTEVSWNTAPPPGRPGSALVSRLMPIPSSKAWFGHSPSTITTRVCMPSKARAWTTTLPLALPMRMRSPSRDPEPGQRFGVDQRGRPALAGDAGRACC